MSFIKKMTVIKMYRGIFMASFIMSYGPVSSSEVNDLDLEQIIKMSLVLFSLEQSDLEKAITNSLLRLSTGESDCPKEALNVSLYSQGGGPIIEREITSNDYLEFGEIYKILFERRKIQMLDTEFLAFPDQILHFKDVFDYGIEEAAKALNLTMEVATELNYSILNRESILKDLVTNPADKETYLLEYIKQYAVSRKFAERVMLMLLNKKRALNFFSLRIKIFFNICAFSVCDRL